MATRKSTPRKAAAPRVARNATKDEASPGRERATGVATDDGGRPLVDDGGRPVMRTEADQS